MARARITICSGCLNDFKDNDLYIVSKPMNRDNPKNGYYTTPFCEKCIKDKDSYHKIVKEPKNKK